MFLPGCTNSALAKATLILHPPDKDLVGLLIISVLNPSPPKITEALASAVCASICSNLS